MKRLPTSSSGNYEKQVCGYNVNEGTCTPGISFPTLFFYSSDIAGSGNSIHSMMKYVEVNL